MSAMALLTLHFEQMMIDDDRWCGVGWGTRLQAPQNGKSWNIHHFKLRYRFEEEVHQTLRMLTVRPVIQVRNMVHALNLIMTAWPLRHCAADEHLSHACSQASEFTGAIGSPPRELAPLISLACHILLSDVTLSDHGIQWHPRASMISGKTCVEFRAECKRKWCSRSEVAAWFHRNCYSLLWPFPPVSPPSPPYFNATRSCKRVQICWRVTVVPMASPKSRQSMRKSMLQRQWDEVPPSMKVPSISSAVTSWVGSTWINENKWAERKTGCDRLDEVCLFKAGEY